MHRGAPRLASRNASAESAWSAAWGSGRCVLDSPRASGSRRLRRRRDGMAGTGWLRQYFCETIFGGYYGCSTETQMDRSGTYSTAVPGFLAPRPRVFEHHETPQWQCCGTVRCTAVCTQDVKVCSRDISVISILIVSFSGFQNWSLVLVAKIVIRRT